MTQAPFQFQKKIPENAVKFILFSDGGCWPNDSTGHGGWACIVRGPEGDTEYSGAEFPTTNNRMELRAIIVGLSKIPDGSIVKIVSDSQYCLDGIRSWMHNWTPKKWRKIKNPDLWRILYAEWDRLFISTEWVRGHTGHPENERCDVLAEQAVAKFRLLKM